MSSRFIKWQASAAVLVLAVFGAGSVSAVAASGGTIRSFSTFRASSAAFASEGGHSPAARNAGRAIYPFIVDSPAWIEQEIVANDGTGGDYLGVSVTMDGNTALVSAPHATVAGNDYQGAVYVFTKANGTWSQTAKLTASDGAAGDDFGYSIAIAGNTVLIGAPYASVAGTYQQGAAYVFTRSDGTWSETAKLTADDGGALNYFGYSVALDGTAALIGAYGAGVGDNYGVGAAYVFDDTDGSWSQTQKLTASDGAEGDWFGWAVALAGDTALIGADQASVGGNQNQGAAYVFAKENGVWSQTRKLVASDGAAYDYFGNSVGLDGTTALVGEPNFNNFQGAVYIFNNANGIWNETQKLVASDGAEDNAFGRSVAISGGTILVGADGAGSSYPGAGYLFTDSNGTWYQTRKLVAGDGVVGNLFGFSVALDRGAVLIGAFGTVVGGHLFQGTAYFYGETDLSLAVSAPEIVDRGETYVSQTIATNNASAASPAVAVTVAVPAAASFVSATATQGRCSETSNVVTCDFGAIDGNAGTATANVTLKAIGDVGETIDNTASVIHATPSLTASTATTIASGGGCPADYNEYDGSLNPSRRAHSPIYQAPAGEENAILTAPTGFQFYAVFQNARFGRKVYRIPGNEVHRRAPAGYFTWVVKAGTSGGTYTLCVLRP